MKKRMIVAACIITVVTLCAVSAKTFFVPSNAINKTIDEEMSNINADIRLQIDYSSELSFSSNPYDYIKGNASFEEVVKLGYEAVPVIQKKIQQSSENGLTEYILAIAAETIAQTDLKTVLGGTYRYETAKTFSNSWDAFTKDMKNNVRIIIEENDEPAVRDAKLLDLGIYAIAYIVDEYQAGKKDLAGVIVELSKKVPEMNVDDANQNNADSIIESNKKILRDLKQQCAE